VSGQRHGLQRRDEPASLHCFKQDKMLKVLFTTLLIAIALPLTAAEFAVKVATTPVPKDVSAAVKKTLGKNCIQLSMGEKPWLEFWLRAPLESR